MKNLAISSAILISFINNPALAADWNLSVDGTICHASLDVTSGKITLSQDSNENNKFIISIKNPSWIIQQNQKYDLEIKFRNFKPAATLNGLDVLESVPQNFIISANVNSGSNNFLYVSLDRSILNDWARYSPRGFRISIYYKDAELTGLMPLPMYVYLHLNKCHSPF